MDTQIQQQRATRRRFPLLSEIGVSVNIATAAVYGLLVYISKVQLSVTPPNDSTYYFFRAAFRINDLLRLNSVEPVSTNAVARQFPSRSSQVGEELLVILTLVGVAALVVLFLRLFSQISIYRALIGPQAFFTSLFALPVCYLSASYLTWNLGWLPGFLRYPHWQSTPTLIFVGEVACVFVCLVLLKSRTPSNWTVIPFLIFHCMFWQILLLSEVRVWFNRLYTEYLLVFVLPLSAFIWIRYRELMSESHEGTHKNRARKLVHLAAAAALVTLGFVWGPSKERSLCRSRNLDSVTVQLARGPCYGACPSYTITIHGSGQIVYEGQAHTRFQCQKLGSIPPEKILEILRSLDHAHFLSLEDRAFLWGFDSPSVGVLISIDGKSKRVVSDATFTGARGGHQDQFVKAVDEIDRIVGSSRWVSCEGPCWN